ncbi:MAG TPA: asparagine synthase B, partial [Steroidobacteraceae bacterium]|nr:asparagine synthase B [Steroidobacteraceae bacterium]
MAHRRLAILDLSEGGHQPMEFESQVLTYNGEIYNHPQLRASLPGPWHSTGDTEVLVHLLARHGGACLERLVGMFAFGVWDRHRRRLLLARDRLGIKP